MVVFDYTGAFVPAELARQLAAAGVSCRGVTCSEDADGSVIAVQAICDDGTDKASVDAAVAAYTPPGPPPAAAPTPEQVAGQVASTISSALASLDPSTATVADVIDTISNALAPYT